MAGAPPGADLLSTKVQCGDMEGERSVIRVFRKSQPVDLDTVTRWEFLIMIAEKLSEKSHSTPVMLKKLTEVLSEEAISTGKPTDNGEPLELFSFCKRLPKAIRVCLDDADMAKSHPDQEEFRAQVFEVLCKLVEFTVAFLSHYVGKPLRQEKNGQELYLPALIHILEALYFALDSDMRYYSLPHRENGHREILVLQSRLKFALRVPGYAVKVFDATDSRKHYFCSQKGVNLLGATCKCCKPPSDVDAALVSVYWHFANTASVNGYELLLKILKMGTLRKILIANKRKSLQLVALIIRPLGQVLRYYISNNSWRIVIQHLEGKFSDGDMMRSSCFAFEKVFQILKKALIDKREGHSTGEFECAIPFENIVYSRRVFMDILIHLHKVWSWSLSYSQAYRSGNGAVLSSDDPGQLLVLFLERIGESKGVYLVSRIFGEFLECAQASGNEVPFVKNILHWLKEGEVILTFLTVACSQEMIKLVEFAGKEGLVLKEEEFVAIINHDLESENGPCQTLHERHAHARVVATILKNFNLDPYRTKSKTSGCEWLKRWQAKDSVISSRIVRCILEKLIVCDKNRKLRIRLLNLLWNHVSDLPASEFESCLTKIACHYTSIAEPKIMIHPGEETEKFLQACSSAVEECTVSRRLGIKFEDKAVIEQNAKMYQDMEVNFNFETSLQLKRVLDIDVSLSVHKTSEECLNRLGLAQQLISGLKTSTHNNMASVMSSAIAPELRTLEAIKRETALRPELCQRMQDVQERHLREYDALKRDQYNRLKKFFQDCFQVKVRLVRDALYAKAEVLAAVGMANLQSKTESSSDGIRRRVMQKVENTLEETEEEHRKCMEKVPNLECNVCFEHFIATRKRACFDPCGHTGTCIDCGMQEWKRRKTCPLCQCDTVKPIAVPSALFFG